MQGAEKNILARMDLEHMDALSPPESDCPNFLCSSKQCATKNAKSQVYEQKIFYFNLTWFESLRQTLPSKRQYRGPQPAGTILLMWALELRR